MVQIVIISSLEMLHNIEGAKRQMDTKNGTHWWERSLFPTCTLTPLRIIMVWVGCNTEAMQKPGNEIIWDPIQRKICSAEMKF